MPDVTPVRLNFFCCADHVSSWPNAHTMRRTKESLIFRRKKNLRAVQLLLGHTKLESTVRYLAIEVDDALEMAEQTEG
jgi:site-specific recombinase XerC